MAQNETSSSSIARKPSERSPLLDRTTTAALAPQEQPPANAVNDVQPSQDQSSVEEGECSTARLCVVLGSSYFGLFLAALDSTIIATLSAPISDSFDQMKMLSWLASGYLIANAGFQPISGKVSDIFGRRSCLIAANLCFAAGNLICGLAKDEWVMILGRVVAGVGGGCINTISTFVASDLVPLRRRGLWQGVGNLCWGAGAGCGGLFGGWMNDTIGWRWAFLIQVPLILFSSVIVFFTMNIPVKDSNTSRIKRVDFLGSTFLVVALVLLLLGINSGGNVVPWGHPLVYVSILASGSMLVAFVMIEDKVAAEPVIPVRLLVDRTVASACLVNWVANMAYFAYLFYIPVYFQVKGLSATQAGVRLIPNAVGLAIGSLGSGVVMRATGRYFYLNLATQGLFVLACALILGVFDINTPAWPPFVLLFIGGFGYGAMLTITLLALISAVPHNFQAVIPSASYAARSTGSTIGIAIGSAVFQNVLVQSLWREFGDEKNTSSLIQKLRDSIGAVRQLEEPLRSCALAAYMSSLHAVFATVLGLSILGAIASICMRENTLHNNLARK